MARVISVFRSSVRSHATHAIGELKNMNYDLTFGVVLSTVPYGAVEKSYKMQQIDKGRLSFRLIQEVL